MMTAKFLRYFGGFFLAFSEKIKVKGSSESEIVRFVEFEIERIGKIVKFMV